MVDVDEEELNKPSIIPDLKIKADALKFISLLSDNIADFKFSNSDWIEQTKAWKKNYPVNLPEYKFEQNGINTVSYTHLRAHETRHDLVCRLLLEKKKK